MKISEFDKMGEPMNTDKQPKDYADKSWVNTKTENIGSNTDDAWMDENKESYAKIAKYWFFIAAASACGYIFMLGVISE